MKTFGGIDAALASASQAEIVLQSIPYDGTSTWGKGADQGFDAFIDASENMELYDIETDTEVFRRGIFMPPAWKNFKSPEDMVRQCYEGTKDILRTSKFPTFFGGEHSVSIGVLKAFYEKYTNLSVLHFDAHADLRAEFGGTPYNHACALHDASQATNLVQVGTRSMDLSEKAYMNREKVFFAHDIRSGMPWKNEVLDLLGDDVYITIDLDAFDPSIMPATGTPEPNGLFWHEVVTCLRKVFQNKNVVGFDIVELAPIEGLRAPQFLAAKLYYKMLSYRFE